MHVHKGNLTVQHAEDDNLTYGEHNNNPLTAKEPLISLRSYWEKNVKNVSYPL